MKKYLIIVIFLLIAGVVYTAIGQPMNPYVLRFLDLVDAPDTFSGQAGKFTKVNAGENALEFGTPAGAGDMEKVDYDVLDDSIVDGDNTAYGVGWNGVINAASKDAIYDKIETLGGGGDMTKAVYDTDNDSLIDQAAGGTELDTSGVTDGQLLIGTTAGNVWALGTITEGLAIDITNGGGSIAAAFDPTELLGNRTWGDASTDTIVWTWNRATGTDPTMTFGNGFISHNGDLKILGDDLFMTTNTDKALLVGDGTNFNPVVSTGDVIISNDGSSAIQANAVNDTHIDWGTGANQVSLDDVTEGTTVYYTYSAHNGTFRESFDADVTSAGGVVTMSIEQSGTGDLTTQFSSGIATYDCTPADTIVLTAGSDTSPQGNWIYILQSAPSTLVKSTTAWPSAEHIKVGYFFVQSAASVQTDSGPFINQNWNDHLTGTTSQGHISHIGRKIRSLGSTYFSGVSGNGATASYYTLSAGNSEFISTSGVIDQMHPQTYSAMNTSTGSIVHVVNSSVSAYRRITDLFSITTDSTGAAISNNKYFNLVIWGVINKTGERQVLMVNVPGGFYNAQADAENDVSGHDSFNIPRQFGIDSSNGFLICRTTFQMGATWSHVSTVDLRGTTPQSASGGAGGIATSFADNAFTVFDNTDITKVMAFDVGANISAATTRTLTPLDKDYTIGDLLADGTVALAGAWNMGSQATTNVNIDSGTINGITDLAVVDGGTGASTLNNLITLTTHTTGNYSTGNAEGGDALVAIAVEITDNESTDEENPLVFVAGADPDGGDLPLETDGDITYNPSTGELRVTSNIVGQPRHLRFNIVNPLATQTEDNELCLWPVTDAALTVTKIVVTLNSAANEVAGDLKYADTFIGLANPVVINVFDTTAGVLSDDSISSGSVAAGKAIYIAFDSAPNTAITQMCVDIIFDYD